MTQVLQSLYGVSGNRLASVIRDFLSFPGVQVTDDWPREGSRHRLVLVSTNNALFHDEPNSTRVLTYLAIVEHSEVKLPETVKLPEHAKVDVVVPGVKDLQPSTNHTPHLLRAGQAADFAVEIVEREDAAVR